MASKGPIAMRELNRLSVAEVATLIGHIYEKSPWIVDRTLADATVRLLIIIFSSYFF